MPAEYALVDEYRVSRATVRQALKTLEAQRLVLIQHGKGTFARDLGTIDAGIEELRSITETIAEQGRRPGMEYLSVVWRPASDAEALDLQLSTGDEILEVRRTITADGVVVAHSFDQLPRAVVPDDTDPSTMRGSMFAFLERHGASPVRATAQVHAVRADTVDAIHPDGPDGLYLLLDQVQFDAQNRPVMRSHTYFAEGRFRFRLNRAR